jgi:hypothetical protein
MAKLEKPETVAQDIWDKLDAEQRALIIQHEYKHATHYLSELRAYMNGEMLPKLRAIAGTLCGGSDKMRDEGNRLMLTVWELEKHFVTLVTKPTKKELVDTVWEGVLAMSTAAEQCQYLREFTNSRPDLTFAVFGDRRFLIWCTRPEVRAYMQESSKRLEG